MRGCLLVVIFDRVQLFWFMCVRTFFFTSSRISGQKKKSRMEFVRWKSCLLLTHIEILKWCKYARKFTLQNNHMVVPTNAVALPLCFHLLLCAVFPHFSWSFSRSLSHIHSPFHSPNIWFGRPYYIKAIAVRGQCEAWFIACPKQTGISKFVAAVIDICIIESLYYTAHWTTTRHNLNSTLSCARARSRPKLARRYNAYWVHDTLDFN